MRYKSELMEKINKKNLQWIKKVALLLSLFMHALLCGWVYLAFRADSLMPSVHSIELVEFPSLQTTSVLPQPPLPIQPQPPQEKPKLKKEGVYGLSRKSLTLEKGDDAEVVKLGNTVAKEQDDRILKPGDDDLPLPVEEYTVTKMPRLKEEVRISYPEEARKNRIQGTVLMDLLIDTQGTVRQIQVLRGPDQSLNEAAQKAAALFQFEPAFIQDTPVAVRIRYAYHFVLDQH